MIVIPFLLCLLLFATTTTTTSTTGRKGKPLVLIPGDGGSQLDAKLNGKPEVVHYICSNVTDDYFPLWLNLELVTPYVLDCTVDNLRLLYNPVTKKTSFSPGVDIRIPNFGKTESVEYLDESHISLSSYYAPLVAELVRLGYTRGKDVVGAPYDFRKAPDELGDYFKNLTALIETSFLVNKEKCVVICHSLGNMIFTYFMSQKSQSWKDKYVDSYIALSAPLGGAAKLLRLYASGDTLGERFVSAIAVRPMQRTFPSSAFLLPYEGDGERFWKKDHVFVITPKRNYTLADYTDFAQDIGFPYMHDMRLNTGSLVNVPTMHPGVDIYCIHGWNIDTPEVFTYTGDMFPDSQPYVKYSNGDGTVNDKSLLGCDYWNNTGKYHFDHHYVKTKGEHMQILANLEMIEYVTKVLKAK